MQQSRRAAFDIFGADSFTFDRRPSVFDWVFFGIDQLLGVAIFDVFDILDARLSQVDYVAGSPIALVVLVFRLALALGFIAILFRAFELVRRGGVRAFDPLQFESINSEAMTDRKVMLLVLTTIVGLNVIWLTLLIRSG